MDRDDAEVRAQLLPLLQGARRLRPAPLAPQLLPRPSLRHPYALLNWWLLQYALRLPDGSRRARWMLAVVERLPGRRP